MRKVKITTENADQFASSDTYGEDILLTIDELLSRHGLELVMGDDRSSDYRFKIAETLFDGEYDADEAHKILYRG